MVAFLSDGVDCWAFTVVESGPTLSTRSASPQIHIVEMNGDSYRLRHSREDADSWASDDRDDEYSAPPTPFLPSPATSPLR